MINVIERSLSTSVAGGAAAVAGGAQCAQVAAQSQRPHLALPPSHLPSGGAPTTIHELLEHSDPTPRRPGMPVPKTAMAPPRSAPSSNSASASNDCETLDLSMPRRREASPPGGSHPSQMGAAGQPLYREPPIGGHHPRSSPNMGQPPPAHSGNKVKTNPDPYFRSSAEQRVPPPAASPSVTYGPDGRPLSTSPHLGLHPSRTAPSPGLSRPGPSGHVASVAPPPSRHPPGVPLQYMQRPSAPVSKALGGPSPVSPKMTSMAGRPIAMTTGSITQGTPVNQGGLALHRAAAAAYDPLMKVTAPEKSGSITHGTPMFEKKHGPILSINEHGRYSVENRAAVQAAAAAADHYRRTTSPGGYPYSSQSPVASRPSSAAAAAAYAAAQQEPHMSSRQVIMNDYAMARGPEMQRRPDSREHPGSRALSPARGSSRDHSPRPRSLDPRAVADPRAAQVDLRRDPRAELRLVSELRSDPNHRGDPRAMMIHDIRVDPRAAAAAADHRSIGLEHRGDPRLGLDPRGDPRAGLEAHRAAIDPRIGLDPRAGLDPRLSIDHRRLAASATDSRSEVRIIQDTRTSSASSIDPRSVDFRNARAIGYYNSQAGQQIPPQQQPQSYMTSDGKYVIHSGAPPPGVRTRSPPTSHRTTPNSTPPPPRATSAATIIQRSVAGGITSGKPLPQKPGPPVSAATIGGHREVEIYRTNPEVTISKTSSPRHPPSVPHDGSSVHNPLTSLSDVAVQQPKLPERERANLLAQHNSANMSKQEYERHYRERFGAAPPGHGIPSSSAVSATVTRPTDYHTGQIAQQVSLERAKQKYILQDKERVERELGASTSRPPPLALTRPPGLMQTSGQPFSHTGKDEVQVQKLTAASLIDAIITKSITTGPPAELGGPLPQSSKPFSRSPAELAGSTPQEDTAKIAAMQAAANANLHAMQAAAALSKTPPSRSPSLKGGELNGPDGAEHGMSSAPGSRPVSRSSSVNEHRAMAGGGADQQLHQGAPADLTAASKIPSPIPEGMTPEQYWKRRGYPSSAQTPTHSTGMPAPRTVTGLAPSPVMEERQITRVAQPVSPKKPMLEPISPPTLTAPPTGAEGSEQMARFFDTRKRATQPQPPPATTLGPTPLPQCAPGASSQDGRPPGMSPLDYVKNKIVEEMKKSDAPGEENDASETPAATTDSTPASTAPTTTTPTITSSAAAPASAPLKRTHENHTTTPAPSSNGGAQKAAAGETKSKKAKAEATTSNDVFSAPPDSPGSEGEMVIDESVRPETAASSSSSETKTAAPPPPTNSTPATSSSSNSLGAATTVTNSTAAKVAATAVNSKPTAPPPSAATPTATPAAAASKAPLPKPTYEPLSDDE
jgi:hypothetical protein